MSNKTATTTIRQGSVGPIWRVGVPEIDTNGLVVKDAAGKIVYVDLAGYSCSVKPGSAAARDETKVSADGTKFLVQLTAAETAALGSDELGETHAIGIKVVNPSLSLPYVAESCVKITILLSKFV